MISVSYPTPKFYGKSYPVTASQIFSVGLPVIIAPTAAHPALQLPTHVAIVVGIFAAYIAPMEKLVRKIPTDRQDGDTASG